MNLYLVATCITWMDRHGSTWECKLALASFTDYKQKLLIVEKITWRSSKQVLFNCLCRSDSLAVLYLRKEFTYCWHTCYFTASLRYGEYSAMYILRCESVTKEKGKNQQSSAPNWCNNGSRQHHTNPTVMWRRQSVAEKAVCTKINKRCVVGVRIVCHRRV